jgi:glycosyltransferase involved in cell wall biosynthesis
MTSASGALSLLNWATASDAGIDGIGMVVISIITPVYNGERFIEACIRNVIEQRCPEAEHLIIDACSNDRTVEIIREFAGKYPHIRWLSEKDRGQSDAMNKGIALAKGEIVSFLNVDDFYEPGVLNRVADVTRTLPAPGLVVANCNIWDEEGNLQAVARPARLKLHQLLLGPALNPFPVNPTEYFYHKSLHDVIGPYNVDEHYALDLDFLLRAVQHAHVVYLNETWGNYRLINGTKTFDDQQNGLAVQRRNALIRSYRNCLPGYVRRFFWLYKAIHTVLFCLGCLMEPRRLRGGLLQKLRNLLRS